jgi:hypothetical protein
MITSPRQQSYDDSEYMFIPEIFAEIPDIYYDGSEYDIPYLTYPEPLSEEPGCVLTSKSYLDNLTYS